MEELSLHLLDLVENAIRADADFIKLDITEEPDKDVLFMKVEDNGKGMEPELAAKASDPFYTTRTTRRVGLGLSLLKANAQACDGDLTLESEPSKGTKVKVWFTLSHLDRQPLGDWPATIAGLILTQQEVDFIYTHRIGDEEFELDTRELREELGKDALADPAVIAMLREQMIEALAGMGSRA
jgi:anti-sigma regulatory factor (Ser/Thr protein kinase)